ncbi:hypothetical protein ZIOFF_047483 [Zingiber officinale]|uniref:Uncharacterized protein n=1 Tax=Zingiber officinale TaxID=94328 RepID=A0A8J5G658_ZINOF|nr:hypothetical protein ZIOFF_047483 [Zingiber officinale]
MKSVPSVIILLDNVSKQAIEMKRAWRWNRQTFIMIKPYSVQRGLVCSPSPSPLISSSFASFIYSSALHCVGEIISRFEKKGFYLKGEDFTNCNPFFVFPIYFREETRNFLGYFCASIRVEVGRRGTLLCGETLRRPLHKALLWFPCGVHHLWSGGSDGMDAKECGGQTLQLRLAGSMMLPSNMVTTMLIEGEALTKLLFKLLFVERPELVDIIGNMMSVAASFYKATLAVTTGISAPFNNLAIIYKQQILGSTYIATLLVQPLLPAWIFNHENCCFLLVQTDADGLVNRGNTFKEIRRVTEAIQDYICAVNIRPTMPEAHANLASTYKDR